MDVGQAALDAVVVEREFLVVDAEQVQHGRVEVVPRDRVFIDADLDQYDEIWAAAGSPNAVFRLTPADLRRVTGGQVIAVK